MAQLDIGTIRAGVVAHAIRLGKRPTPGMVIDFAFQLSDIERADLAAGRLEAATPVTEQRRAEFTVTEADIEAAKLLINTQQATYREPKLTTVKL